MKKIKPNIQKQINNIDGQIMALDANYRNYTDGEFHHLLNTLSARRAALLLIGYNIAHRGKKLHERTIRTRASRLGDNGDFIISELENNARTDQHITYLCSALREYDITLLDKHQLDNIAAQRNIYYDALGPYGGTTAHGRRMAIRRIAKCNKQIALFHKQLTSNYQVHGK